MNDFMEERLENQEERDCNRCGCSSVSYQDVNVHVPVTIHAYAKIGRTRTQCMGRTVILSGGCPHQDNSDNGYHFTISQDLRVEIPVTFGANVDAGEASVISENYENEER